MVKRKWMSNVGQIKINDNKKYNIDTYKKEILNINKT